MICSHQFLIEVSLKDRVSIEYLFLLNKCDLIFTIPFSSFSIFLKEIVYYLIVDLTEKM